MLEKGRMIICIDSEQVAYIDVRGLKNCQSGIEYSR